MKRLNFLLLCFAHMSFSQVFIVDIVTPDESQLHLPYYNHVPSRFKKYFSFTGGVFHGEYKDCQLGSQVEAYGEVSSSGETIGEVYFFVYGLFKIFFYMDEGGMYDKLCCTVESGPRALPSLMDFSELCDLHKDEVYFVDIVVGDFIEKEGWHVPHISVRLHQDSLNAK